MSKVQIQRELARDECFMVLELRLLIARAAQRDSLSWWDDESLTQSGAYLLERLFSNDPRTTARMLALRAAKVRHHVVFAEAHEAIHLFRLDHDGQVELALRNVTPQSLEVHDEPIRTGKALEEKLENLIQPLPMYEIVAERAGGKLEIKLTEESADGAVLKRALALAWVYLKGSKGKPIFPYFQQ